MKGHNSCVVDPTVRKAVQQAEEALSLSLEQRKGLVNCLASDEEDDNDDDEDCDQTMPSEDESPSKERAKELMKKINQLPDQMCAIFSMRYLYGFKYDEIAEEMDLSINTVKTQLLRSKKKLRNLLLNERASGVIIFILFNFF